MRAALLTREFPPEVYGGAGVHVANLAEVLSRHIDVAVHCFGEPRPSPLVAATYQPWHTLPEGRRDALALRTMSVDLAMAAGVEGADLVHSHTWYANFAGHLAKLLYAIPHVLTTHSLEPMRPWKSEQLGGGQALAAFCEKTALRSADAIIAVSEAMRRDILSCYPEVRPEKVTVVHNGIDTSAWHRDERIDALRRYGVDPQRPAVVFVGRMTPQKGILRLLDAAPQLAPGTQLVLCAGAADTESGAEKIRSRVEQLRRDREGVVWIERQLPRDDVVQLLSHATVFVCPSVYEPFGLVNLEAMACGAPVVATATGGVPEVVVHGETGLLVGSQEQQDIDEPGVAAELANAVNSLLADPARARSMGEAGRRRVEERFRWSEVGKATVALYRRLLSPGRSNPDTMAAAAGEQVGEQLVD